MRNKAIMVSLLLISILLIACDKKEPVISANHTGGTGHSVTTATAQEDHPDLDLKDKNIASRFSNYFTLGKEALRTALQKDFKETPKAGTDAKNGEEFLELEKAGLKFVLTDEADVPVSRVEVGASSSLHMGKARGQMSFDEIMKDAGRTLIRNTGDVCIISYPIDGYSVDFTSSQIYENKAVMSLSTWGVTDNIPTLSSPSLIELDGSSISLPESWQGRVALDDSGNGLLISWIGKTKVYPLFQLYQFAREDWGSMDKKERQKFIVAAKTEEQMVAVLLSSNSNVAAEEEQDYSWFRSEIEKVMQTLKLSGSHAKVYKDLQATPCTESLLSKLNMQQYEAAFTEYHERTSYDQSEAGVDELYSDLARCFREKTDQLLQQHSDISHHAGDIRKAVKQLNESWMQVQSLVNGGGTMWNHFLVRTKGTNEAALYIYVNKLTSNSGTTAEDSSQPALARLKAARDFYASGEAASFNEEDADQMKPAIADLTSAYDQVIKLLTQDNEDYAAASAYLLQILANQYDRGEAEEQ